MRGKYWTVVIHSAQRHETPHAQVVCTWQEHPAVLHMFIIAFDPALVAPGICHLSIRNFTLHSKLMTLYKHAKAKPAAYV